jgi:gliding motility-associated-like protein
MNEFSPRFIGLPLLLCWIGFGSIAQNDQPCFRILENRGGSETNRVCVGQTMYVSNCSKGTNLSYQFSDNLSRTTDSSFVYSSPGIYRITQFGTFNARGDTLSKQVQVLSTPAPAFLVRYCSKQQVEVQLTDQQYDRFEVSFSGSTPQQLVRNGIATASFPDASPRQVRVSGFYNGLSCKKDTLFTILPVNTAAVPLWQNVFQPAPGSINLSFSTQPQFQYQLFQQQDEGPETELAVFNPPAANPQLFTQQNLNPTSTYRYRVRVTDGCGITQASIQIQTLRLNLEAVPDQHTLSWPVYTGESFSRYEVLKNGKVVYTQPNPNLLGYIDNDLRCRQTYTYQLAVRLSNGLLLLSPEVKATASSLKAPAALENVSVSAVQNKTQLNWNKISGAVYYQIRSSTEGGSFVLLDSILTPPFNTSLFESRVCYQVVYRDSCGNLSAASTEVCPVFLTQNGSMLSWTPYQGWQGGAEAFYLEKLDAKGNVQQEVWLGLSLQYALPDVDTSSQLLRLRIRAVRDTLTSFSNTLLVEQGARLTLPTAFTPNQDQLNDLYQAEGLFIDKASMKVFSSWGQLLFTTQDLKQGWDGNIAGNPAPAGNYVCQVEATDFTGKKLTRQATFTLIR